ncbi:MAG: sulfite exporter TauE/SafE family protein [Verrucomicrobiae bacterium]|nr:sulfite exporter TauE/SafE family protein [Verrucomicrobiae bacterium]
MELTPMLLLAVLGFLTGICAGLLGIGGGTLIVPGLLVIFHVLNLHLASDMHTAMATSLAAMIFTASSSTFSRWKRGDINWEPVRIMTLPIVVGVVLGTLLSARLNAAVLKFIFAIVILCIALRMIIPPGPKAGERTYKSILWQMLPMSLIIGLKSGLLGVGGGPLSVPFLNHLGLDMRKSTGTSTFFTLPVALTGTLTYYVLAQTGLANHLGGVGGLVYWPAVLMVVPFSMAGAPVGSLISRRISGHWLKIVFALFLILIAVALLTGLA